MVNSFYIVPQKTFTAVRSADSGGPGIDLCRSVHRKANRLPKTFVAINAVCMGVSSWSNNFVDRSAKVKVYRLPVNIIFTMYNCPAALHFSGICQKGFVSCSFMLYCKRNVDPSVIMSAHSFVSIDRLCRNWSQNSVQGEKSLENKAWMVCSLLRRYPCFLSIPEINNFETQTSGSL